jgi:ABC-type transport system involved in cytochrome bd biosynthesis fused ATPase/permease subunit
VYACGVFGLSSRLVWLSFSLTVSFELSQDWTNESKNYGYYYALLLFGIMVIKTFIESNYFFIVTTVGVQVRNILIGAIYSKSLNMSSAATHRRSTGETVNIMQVLHLSHASSLRP